MLPDRVSNPGPLTYESGALPIALRGPAAANQRVPPSQKITAHLADLLSTVCHGRPKNQNCLLVIRPMIVLGHITSKQF